MSTLLSNIFQSRHFDFIGSRTAALACQTRQVLASQIETALHSNKKRGGETDERLVVDEIDETIKNTFDNLVKLEEREKFIGMRVEAYRNLLMRRTLKLKQTIDDSSFHFTYDNNDSWKELQNKTKEDKMKEQQQQYEQELSIIIELQKTILVQMELSRRKLVDLQKKRDGFVQKREECLEFLMVSSILDIHKVQNLEKDLYLDEVADEERGCLTAVGNAEIL